MSFFKRKDKFAIPAVEDTSARNELLRSSNKSSTSVGSNSTSPKPPPSYRSNANTYIPSRDGDPYNNTPAPPPAGDPYAARDKYHRNNGVGDVYTRAGGAGTAGIEQDRSELFAGYNPAKSGSGRFFDGPPGMNGPGDGEGGDEDVEGIKTQTRYVKQESVNSTRNALRMAREAEETARNTLGRLGDQSEKLANTERHLDVSKGHSQRADDRTDELKQLNRSIFRPVITFNKDAKRAAKDAKIQSQYEEERSEREKAMMDVRETQNRLGRAATYGRSDPADDNNEEAIGGTRSMGSGRFRNADQLAARKEQRKRYQFEADEEDDQMEDELDDNLDEISDMTKRLKALGSAMGQELDNQNSRIERIEGKTVNLDGRIFRNTERLKKIK